MANLAIKGHATRSKEVIEILEMLGGKNNNCLNGVTTGLYYFIEDYTIYSCEKVNSNYIIFTLEEFLEKFPYKVEDRVKIPNCDVACRVTSMIWNDIEIEYETTNSEETFFADELQPYKKETMENKPNLLQQLKEYFDNTPRDVLEKEWNELSYLNEIGPTVYEYLECVKKYRQSNQYPKTYEECCLINGCDNRISLKIIGEFTKLINARNAYWKIAGEQMGLGKPWEPDWDDENEFKYGLYHFRNGIMYDGSCITPTLLAFPTEEMRDAFYENFKDLIEQCKELL